MTVSVSDTGPYRAVVESSGSANHPSVLNALAERTSVS